jgi:anti-anti-sigma factor
VPADEEWPVHAGDRLSVGPLEFLVQFREKQLAQKDAEEWALKTLDQDAQREVEEFEEPMDQSVPHTGRAPANAAAAAASILDRLQLQRGIVRGPLRVSENAGITVIRFNDTHLVDESEITFINREILDNISQSRMRVLLDFKNVRRLSSHAAEMIRDVYRHVNTQRGSMALCRVRPEIRGILETLGLFHLLPYFGDRKSALAAKW